MKKKILILILILSQICPFSPLEAGDRGRGGRGGGGRRGGGRARMAGRRGGWRRGPGRWRDGRGRRGGRVGWGGGRYWNDYGWPYYWDYGPYGGGGFGIGFYI